MNKYKIKTFLLFIFLLTIINVANASAMPIPLLGKTIYLDAGHGGKDPGAYYKDIYEEDINLKIVLKLKDKLESMGATVLLTRDGDYDLSDKNAYFRKRSDLGKRAKLINESNADIYLSIHLNSSLYSTWSGAQAFYDDINKDNKNIAEIFQKAFNKKLNSTKKIKEMTNLYMYKRINIPGVLLELGFISNPNERYLLNTDKYQELIVDTLSNSLLQILL